MNLESLREFDKKDPLAYLRDRFELPDDKVYLDGNSLGALPRGVSSRVKRLISEQWGTNLVAGWNANDWIGLPANVGDRIAGLIGAAPGQVTCADSISVNLFKLLSTALSLRPDRNTILSQQDNFPTDLYMAEGLSDLLGPDRCKVRSVPADELLDSIDDEVAVLMLTQVNFRDGSLHDIPALTRKAHDRGALVLWDLAHSAGVIPLELDTWNVDMAVGCGYKYLNGGPGAPAFLYLAKRHHGKTAQPLRGWMGHSNPFAFTPDYVPSGDIRSFLAGTPGILGMKALDAALDVYDGVSIEDLRSRSLKLTQAFMNEVSRLNLPGVEIITPQQPELRGSQVSLTHKRAYPVAQAMIAHDIVVDYRAPDIIRFGFSPLYNTFFEAGLAAQTLAMVVNDKKYTDPAYSVERRVT